MHILYIIKDEKVKGDREIKKGYGLSFHENRLKFQISLTRSDEYDIMLAV
jgi:hypothetical protein